MLMGGQHLALLDPGADSTIIDKKLVPTDTQLSDADGHLTGVGDQAVALLGTFFTKSKLLTSDENT